MTECHQCGNHYCNADDYGRNLCWFFHETHIHERGRVPRNIDSVDPRYAALVVATWNEADGEYDGFPTKDDFSDEQLEAMREAAPTVLRHIE